MKFGYLLLVLLTAASSAAQSATPPSPRPNTPAKSPLAGYAGTWTSEFEGKPWLILKLVLQNEKFTGSVQHARGIQLNDNGELKSITDQFSTEAVQDSKLSPDGLLLQVKDPESQEQDRYLMRLTGEGTAEIRPVGAELPPGMPKPKPWKLRKEG